MITKYKRLYSMNIDFIRDLNKVTDIDVIFTTGDLNTSFIEVDLLHDGNVVDLNTYRLIINVIKRNQIATQSECEIIDAAKGKIRIPFSTTMLSSGRNYFEILLIKDGTQLPSPKIPYKVLKTIADDINEAIPNTNEFPILIQLIEDVKELKNTTNAFLIEAQKKEDVREGNETTRISQENERQASINNMKNAFDSKITEVNTAKNNMIQDVSNAKDTMKSEVTAAKNDMTSSVDTAKDTMKSEVTSAKNDMISKVNAKITEVDNAKNSMVTKVDNKIVELDDRFNALEDERAIVETKTGTYLTFDNTKDSIVQDIELHGNTIQNPNTLEIKSTGVANVDGTWTYEVVACGENLFNGKVEIGSIDTTTGLNASRTDFVRCVDFIKVNSNTQMVGKLDGYSVRVSCVYFYDINKKFISSANLSSVATPFTTPSNCAYIRFVCYEDKASLDNYKKIKLQEGTIATPYTPYVETRSKIKLPCQLEKWDRLYYDKEENAWVVDKKNVTMHYKDYTSIRVVNSFENCLQVGIKFKDNKEPQGYSVEGSTIICSKPFSHSFDDNEHIWYNSSNKEYMASIPKSKANSADKARDYFANEDVFMKIIDSNYTKIVLPQSEQIKLNSFANKTHIYTISGEVDLTVKATVSKSLASTVQANTHEINILNSKIADIQGLKESQDFAYETDKGYLVCKDTQNGVVKDLKIYGKTLRNYFRFRSQGVANTNIYVYSNEGVNDNTTGGKTFRVFNDTNKQVVVDINSNGVYKRSIILRTTDLYKDIPIAVDEYLYCIYGQSKDGWNTESESDKKLLKNMCILIEDLSITTKPSYFEGIASVGNGNEIEVLSNNGGDLLKNSEVIKGGYYKRTDGTVFQESNSFRIENYIEVVGGMKLYSPQVCIYIAYDRNKNFISGAEISSKEDYTYEVPQNAKYIRFSFYNRLDIINQLWVSTLNKLPNVQYKQYKKPILFKDANGNWKPVTELNEFDYIDTTKNEYGFGTYKFTVNGSEDWRLSSSDSTITRFQLNNPKMDGNRNPLICDKLPLKTDYSDMTKEGCFTSVSGTTLFIDILTSKASTVETFKAHLTTNNMKFVSRALNVVKYEASPLDLESYENETMISFGSGAIAPRASWKITSSLPNFVKELSNQIKQLQEQVYKTNVANFAVALNTLDTKLRLDRLETPQM